MSAPIDTAAMKLTTQFSRHEQIVAKGFADFLPRLLSGEIDGAEIRAPGWSCPPPSTGPPRPDAQEKACS